MILSELFGDAEKNEMKNYDPKPKIQKIKRIIFFIGLLITFSLLPNAGGAATYYIDFQNGSDNNSGASQVAPWKTIPGTRNAADTADQSACWGFGCPTSPTFGSSRKVPAGTTFKLKSGSIHNNINGGRINVSSTYYNINATPSSPILFQRDIGWGIGSVVFDGIGMTLYDNNKTTTGWGLIHINSTIGGISFDGVAGVSDLYDGIIIQNSPKVGLAYYADDTNMMPGGLLQFIKFFNNGTLHTVNDASFSGSGQLYFKFHDGVTIDHCAFDGNNKYTNGLHLGQSYTRVVNTLVSNSVAYNHRGSDDTDVGIGIKAQNSQVTYKNVASYNNDKGFDSGEEGADLSWDIVYKLINCQAYSNATLGAGFSVTSASRTGAANFYAINSIFRDNSGPGIKAYAGPYNIHIIHSVFDNNDVNLLTHPDGIGDSQSINTRIYNSIFYKPTGGDGNTSTAYWSDAASRYVRYSDYNSYIQTNSEYFSMWGNYGGGSDVYNFSYGVNGPGHASGTWYNWKSSHNDANSKGTGANDGTLPPFIDLGNHDYRLTTRYPGTDLSSMPWYISEMGLDRNGIKRTSWDIGPYEYLSTSPPSAPRSLRIR